MAPRPGEGQLRTPGYVELAAMPADAVIPDGIVVIDSTLYVRREPLGTVITVRQLLSGDHLIRYSHATTVLEITQDGRRDH